MVRNRENETCLERLTNLVILPEECLAVVCCLFANMERDGYKEGRACLSLF